VADRPDGAVAIVGMGGLFPGAPSIERFWANVRDGVDAITDVPADRWDPVFFDPDTTAADRFYCRRGGFVDDLATFDPTAFGIMPVAVEGAEPDQLLALAAAAAALEDADGAHKRVAPEKVGVIIGRGGYLNAGVARLDQRVRGAQQLVEALRSLLPDLGEDDLRRVKEDFQARLGPERPEASIGLVPNLTASRIANRLDFQGPAYTVDAACASSLIAVDRGIDELRSGRCDLVVVGGVHHCHDLTLWSVFTQLKALSATQAIRPFSRQADGILVGEGTGLFVLKRLADAERDDDRIYAVVRGTGVASDGRDASLMSPRPEGQVLAVRQAWEAAGLDPATVGLVEAHGTATVVGDATELETLRTVFGGPDAGLPRAGLGSVKSMIGHAMPAAGAAGLAKAALAVFHGELPPTLHAADDPNEALAATRFRLIGDVEPWEGDQARRAGVNAFGFGGINAHVVVEEHPSTRARLAAPPAAALTTAPTEAVATAAPTEPVTAPASGPAPEPVVLVSGRNAADVLGRLEHLVADALWAAPGPVAPVGEGPARLAIVDPTPKRLDLARKVLERGTPFRGRNDVWFEPEPMLAAGGRVAFVFPGVEPTFDPHVDDVIDHFGLPYRLPTAASTLEAQSLGIFTVGRALADALERMGVRPDLVAGHSLGEWTGQVVSGMIPEGYVDTFIGGMRPGAIEVSDVVFVALGCGAEVAAELVAGLPDAHVSHDNCVHQSVICAHPDSMATAMARARERKVLAQELPFRSGFHSPLFEPFVAGLAAQFDALPLQVPRVPMWSATTCAPYPDDHDGIAELALRHLVAPVRFRELVQALHAEGVRAFVQVGTGSLGGFVDDTLRDHDYLVVQANVAKQTGMGQLRRAGAGLWAEGLDVDFSVLEPAAAASSASPRSPATGSPVAAGGGAPSAEVGPDEATGPAGSGSGAAVDPVPAAPPGTELDPAGADRSRSLPLGSSLVRGLAPLDVRTGRDALGGLADLPGSPPVLAELRAALTEAGDAARLVAEAAAARPAARPTLVRADVAGTGAAPVDADRDAAAPPSRVITRELSLDVEPAWADHAFFAQPEGWTDQEDRFPLVPMTGILEMLAEAACELVPGHVAVALEDVRAFQWLAVAPPTTITLRATVDPDAEGPGIVVRTAIDRHARANVRLLPAYDPPPHPVARPVTGSIELPITVDRLYADGHLFHGPEYQGVLGFDRFGVDGVRGRLVSKPAPGSLLDNAGQLFGYWVACAVAHDRLVLPVSIDRISFWGPHPDPGTELDCVVNITSLDEQTVRCDLELTVEDDVVWCRIEGWEDRRFQTDDTLFALLKAPDRLALAQPQPGGWVLAREGWPDSASRDVVRRRFLGRAERAEYDTRNPNAQRQWLLGRIAAKDAVRHHLWAHSDRPIFPIEVGVTNDERGRPLVTGPTDADLRVSIAHTTSLGVALVAEGVDVGIDVEAVAPRSATFEATTLSAAEQAVVGTAEGIERDLLLTRCWAAKEAAAKAAGTGLQGRPKDFEITEATDDAMLVSGRWIATTTIGSPTDPDTKEHVVAWTDLDR
jgi:acyl transferase domain-containing protein/phosphopantetheinyl transferase